MKSYMNSNRNSRKKLKNSITSHNSNSIMNSNHSNNNLNHPFDYREKLAKSTALLADLEKRHRLLMDDYSLLTEKYIYTKRCAVDAACAV